MFVADTDVREERGGASDHGKDELSKIEKIHIKTQNARHEQEKRR